MKKRHLSVKPRIHSCKKIKYEITNNSNQTGASLVTQWSRILLQYRRCGFDPWVRKIPWRRKWQPTPTFLPGNAHGQRSLVGYSLLALKRVKYNLTLTKLVKPNFFVVVLWFYCPMISHLSPCNQDSRCLRWLGQGKVIYDAIQFLGSIDISVSYTSQIYHLSPLTASTPTVTSTLVPFNILPLGRKNNLSNHEAHHTTPWLISLISQSLLS